MQERLELIKQGKILHAANLENDSILLREVMGQQVDAEQEQLEMEEQQMMEQQMAEQQAMEQQAQMDYEAAEGGMPPSPQEQIAPEGQMPQDPTMAGPAQERLQGGPDAQQIQQREFQANAPG